MAEITLTPAQQEAVENRGGSLLVSAAAGSGKTKVLVERLFRYVTVDHSNVDDFLIITFTKAAAAELRSKIAQELGRRLARAPEDTHLRRQLLRVYQADIKTVDAFCTSLLRENTHLLAQKGEERCLSPDFRVLDENEARLLRERVLNRVLDEFYVNLTADQETLANTLGFGRDDGALVQLVLELYEKVQSHARPDRWLKENQEQWEKIEKETGAFDATAYAQALLESVKRRAGYWKQMLSRMAEQMADTPALVNGYVNQFLASAETWQTLQRAADSGSWDGTRGAVREVTFPRLGSVKAADGGELKERAKRLWDGGKDAWKKLMTLLDVSGEEAMADLQQVAPSMAALLALTETFAASYRQEKLRLNAADFSDQEHLALQILLDEEDHPTDLGVQVSARYQEILVDEYQDTNEVQNAIFRAVSREGRNLFTVGDVKQSIYRFRLADPTIFLEKYRAFPHSEQAQAGQPRKILLSQNFRSRQEILDAANFVFSNILSQEMGEMDYGEEEALHFGAAYYPERGAGQTEFHLICAEQRSGNQPQRPVKRLTAEARFVATRIRQLLDEGVPVTDGGDQRPCRPEDVAILLRAPGGRAYAYAQALTEQGIPCSFDAGGDFFSTLEVSVVLSFLEVISNPHQDVPLIAVLRSPVFRFTPDRLAEIRGGQPEGDFYDAVQRDGGKDCAAFLDTLSRLRLLSQDMGAHRLLWHIYNELNVLGIFGAMDGGEERKENLIALSQHAEKFEGGGYCGVFAFVTQMKKLLDSGRPPQTRGASSTAGVQIMSIHKSKGLEFPVVVLADLDHAFSRQDLQTPVLVHPDLGLGPYCVDLDRRVRYPTLARKALEEKLMRENKAEEQRVLYVAMTRAKEKLILVDAMYNAASRMKRLTAMAACPAMPESVGEGKNFADWLLLPLLCRPEAAPLRQIADTEVEALYTGNTAPWQVFVHQAEDFREVHRREAGRSTGEKETAFDPALLEFVYPYDRETQLPAKLTATQLKGRELDEEIAEQAAHVPSLRPLAQPRFRQEAEGLSAAEAGTATHLVLQYLDFHRGDVAAQVEELRQRRLLTDEQAAAVQVQALERFLQSPLAEELRQAEVVLREYPFTLLMDAADYDPAATAGDQIMLQGIVDCCFETPEGLTVVDFKTDRVTGRTLMQRAQHYRPQLEAYSDALTRVLEKPVVRRVLYFLHAGETAEL